MNNAINPEIKINVWGEGISLLSVAWVITLFLTSAISDF